MICRTTAGHDDRVALATGARSSAILQLTWDRVDLVDGRIDFRLPGEAETKKRRPHALVSDHLLRLLRAVKRVSGKNKYVIQHRTGGPLKSIKKAFASACERADLPHVTPHTLKHTAVTWLLRSPGVTIWQVSRLTATTPDTITRVYGKHVDDDLRGAANSVNPQSAEKVPI